MTEKISSSLRESKTARWTVLVLVSFTMMCMYYLTDAMAPLQQDLQSNLHWSATDYGLFTSGYGWFNVFLLMLVFSGMILDKLGTRFTGILAIGIMLIGAGIKYWAISGHFTGSTELTIGSWQILGYTPTSALMAGLGFGIFGVGCEMFGISANKAVVRWFRGKEMALAIGLNTSTGRIGTALAMFTPKPLYNLTKDVSSPVLLSILLLCIGLLVYIFFTVIDKRLDKEETAAGVEAEEEFKFADIKEIASNRAFWYIAILCVLFYSAVFPFIKFATNLIVQKFSVTDSFAGYIPALLPFSAQLLLRICSLSDRIVAVKDSVGDFGHIAQLYHVGLHKKVSIFPTTHIMIPSLIWGAAGALPDPCQTLLAVAALKAFKKGEMEKAWALQFRMTGDDPLLTYKISAGMAAGATTISSSIGAQKAKVTAMLNIEMGPPAPPYAPPTAAEIEAGKKQIEQFKLLDP